MVGIADRWTALQFDSAIMFSGRTIESALMEREETGSGKDKKRENVYTLEQLLDPAFRLPPPPSAMDKEREAVGTFMGLPGIRVVRPGEKVKR